MTVLERLERQAEEASRQADRLTKAAALARELGEDGLQDLLAILAEEQPPNSNGNGNGNGNGHPPKIENEPRGREAVRRIVRERPGVWTLTELRAEMEKRGWFTTATGLEAAAKRLCEINKEGKRDGRGRYVFPSNYGEEVTGEASANGVSDVNSDRLRCR